MSNSNQHQEDVRLHGLLQAARPQLELPPRFRENVWRRLERPAASTGLDHWIAALAGLFLKPRFALATIAVVLVTGAALGLWNGQAQARLTAQERYVASVAMPVAP